MERMGVPVSIGVGGSFDVYSGKFNRARCLCNAWAWSGFTAFG